MHIYTARGLWDISSTNTSRVAIGWKPRSVRGNFLVLGLLLPYQLLTRIRSSCAQEATRDLQSVPLKHQHPFMIYLIKELRDIRIQYPVHLLALQRDRQRIQRVVMATSLSKL